MSEYIVMTKNISLIDSNLTSNFAVDSLKTIPTAAYIHIPFCRRRCFYCDFPISVVGDRQNQAASTMMEEYVLALIEEIKLTPSVKQPLKTVFFWWWYSLVIVASPATADFTGDRLPLWHC